MILKIQSNLHLALLAEFKKKKKKLNNAIFFLSLIFLNLTQARAEDNNYFPVT